MAEQQVPAIGYSITANVGGERQIVFQHFVAQDESDEVANANVDRIMRMIDRQRAIYELPELQAERQKLQEEISQYSEDIVTQSEVNHGRAQAELNVQLQTLQGDRKKFYDEAYNKFRAQGRTGAFEPKGHVAQQLDRLDAGIKQITEALAKNDAERDFFIQNTKANIQRRVDRLAILDEKIAQRQKDAT